MIDTGQATTIEPLEEAGGARSISAHPRLQPTCLSCRPPCLCLLSRFHLRLRLRQDAPTSDPVEPTLAAHRPAC